MIFSRRPTLVVGLDLGTSAIKIAVGERRSDGGLTLIGAHQVESRGMRKGEVVDYVAASACIFQAIHETEEMLNMDIRQVELAMTGGHIESANYRGTVPVHGEMHQITEEDVEEVVERTHLSASLPDDRAVLHVIRQQFCIDGKDGVSNPVGLVGSRLEADTHFIHGISTRLRNTLQCLHSRRETLMDVGNCVFSGLASALAVLGRHEKEMGAILLDIGAGATEYVVYAKGMIRQTGVLAVGGDHLINDLLLGLKLQSRKQVRTLIHEHGSVGLDDSLHGKTVKVKTSELLDREREFLLEHIHTILRHRMDETLRIIHERVREHGLLDLARAGVFLTGGCARIRGLTELAQSIFGMTATVALPQGFDGQFEQAACPELATVLGLVRYGHIKGNGNSAANDGVKGYLTRWLGMRK